MTDPKRAVAVDLSLHTVTGLWRGRASEAGSHRYEFEERIYSGMKRCAFSLSVRHGIAVILTFLGWLIQPPMISQV